MTKNQETPAPVTARPHQAPHEILQQVDALWRQLDAAIDASDEAAMAAPGLVGEWSGKDLIAHLGRWDDAAYTVIAAHLAGRSVADQYDDFDACNARWAAEDRDLSFDQARIRCIASHLKLRQLVADLPAEKWDKLVRGWVRGTSIRHVTTHLADFQARAPSA